MKSSNLITKTRKLITYLQDNFKQDNTCDEDGLLQIYVHLQQAASVFLDQRMRQESKAKRVSSTLALQSNLTLPPQVCYRVTYSSKLVIPKGKTPVEVVIPIINFAVLSNQKKRIGGMLYCDVIDGKVIQVLEGDKKAITELLVKIEDDPRHEDMEILREETVTDRKYEAWGMQFAQTNNDWETVMKVLKEARKEQGGIQRAKGFGSFGSLGKMDMAGFAKLNRNQPLSGLDSKKISS